MPRSPDVQAEGRRQNPDGMKDTVDMHQKYMIIGAGCEHDRACCIGLMKGLIHCEPVKDTWILGCSQQAGANVLQPIMSTLQMTEIDLASFAAKHM